MLLENLLLFKIEKAASGIATGPEGLKCIFITSVPMFPTSCYQNLSVFMHENELWSHMSDLASVTSAVHWCEGIFGYYVCKCNAFHIVYSIKWDSLKLSLIWWWGLKIFCFIVLLLVLMCCFCFFNALCYISVGVFTYFWRKELIWLKLSCCQNSALLSCERERFWKIWKFIYICQGVHHDHISGVGGS